MQRTGIVGLKPVLEEVARDFAGRSDGEIKAELMARLGKSNYIVAKVKDAYEAAFFREYKKFIGEPMPEDPSGPIQIKAELNLPADLEHVREVKEIACYGVMGNPALVINGKVVAVGRVPSKSQLKEWLRTASKK